jgi:hypothetical protein
MPDAAGTPREPLDPEIPEQIRSKRTRFER